MHDAATAINRSISLRRRCVVLEMGGSGAVSRMIGTRYFHVPQSCYDVCGVVADFRVACGHLPAVMRYNQIAGAPRTSSRHLRRAIPAHCISASDVRQRSALPTSQNEFR